VRATYAADRAHRVPQPLQWGGVSYIPTPNGLARQALPHPPEGLDALDDQDLVAGMRDPVRAKRDAAVVVFMERYRPLFYHCIAQLETDQHARDDLHNEVVAYVLERLERDSFDPSKGSFGTWLYRVAWCRCVDLKRKESARRNPKLVPAGEKIPDRADLGAGPGDQAGENEIGDMVRKGMAALESEERALLELRFVDERTIGEIATTLSISIEQTKYRLKRASVALRKVLLNEFALEKAAE